MEAATAPSAASPGEHRQHAAPAPFFRVSTTKFLVLSLTTLSLYELYWFYKNWQLIRAREGTDISPAARTLFAFFFCYQAFCRVRDYPAPGAKNESLAAGALAIGWIVTALLWRLPDPYGLLSLAAVVFMVPVQVAAERVNQAVAPSSDPNDRFSVINWVTVAAGGLLLTLGVVGTFATVK